MNPRDHPHGGGEGKAPIGGQPKTKWGKPAFQRTRKNKRTDNDDRATPTGESRTEQVGDTSAVGVLPIAKSASRPLIGWTLAGRT